MGGPGEEAVLLVGVGDVGWLWSGRWRVWREPWCAGHDCAQDVHGVAAVFAGGVDVAADVQAVLSGLFAGEPAGYLLLGFERAHAALGDVVRRPDPRVAAEPGHVVLPFAAQFHQVPASVLRGCRFRPGD